MCGDFLQNKQLSPMRNGENLHLQKYWGRIIGQNLHFS